VKRGFARDLDFSLGIANILVPKLALAKPGKRCISKFFRYHRRKSGYPRFTIQWERDLNVPQDPDNYQLPGYEGLRIGYNQ
jgi:hypothetical protein